MKKTLRMVLAAFVAVSMVAFVSCGKDDNSNGGNGTEQPTPTPNPNPQPSVNWVDLGLSSGLLWADCNVGATNPEDYGDYFAWGETTTKVNYTWSTYRYCTVDGNGGLATLTKYNTSTTYGTVDNLTTLDSAADAAAVNMGGGARTPTLNEWQELLDNTTNQWTTQNGVNGCLLTAANGNSIFLPAAGYRDGSELSGAGSYGYYWSSSLYVDRPYYARDFRFNSDYQGVYGDNRSGGRSVRAVHAAQE